MPEKKTKGSIFFTDEKCVRIDSLEESFAEHLEYSLAKTRLTVRELDSYKALSLSIRDRLIKKWLRTQYEYQKRDVKRVYYLSMEFLMGRMLGAILINLNYYRQCYDILKKLGYSLEDIRELEPDMGLGNGGLGRLAACFLDSMATMGIPSYGYGIRYEYGIFQQEIKDGYQIEKPDLWLRNGNPWEIYRPEHTYRIRFNGRVSPERDSAGRPVYKWVDTDEVLAVAYDTPVPGYHNNTVNNLRLWQAKGSTEFDFHDFNNGDYLAAVERKNLSENISKVLYPNDNTLLGRELRLKQEYFFVSATLQNIIDYYKAGHKEFYSFFDKTAIQLNDTHPAIAIPELMRILVDENSLGWEEAWDITVNTFGFTNHTVLPEALEKWPWSLMEKLLPRHLQIICEINQRFLDGLRIREEADDAAIQNLSIIEEVPEKKVRMANLAIIGSHSVNGVSKLHTDILTKSVFPEFYKLEPQKFNNKTNGITPRRWLLKSNPFLAGIITDRIGDGWVTDLYQLKKLETLVDNEPFKENWRQAKWINKKNLARYVQLKYKIKLNPDSLFDAQVKRIHEYKRQLLNILHVITLYNRIKDNPKGDYVFRTVLFGGKAAPAYFMAKLIIKLINCVADTVNNDVDIGNQLKVLFLENYGVSLAEKIIPAADLSEQLSTAGMEASGTGNMKFGLNGALTIGTLDGANVEILEEVGKENIFIFGLKSEAVIRLRQSGYNPRDYYLQNPELHRALNMIRDNYFNPQEKDIFKPIFESLVNQGDYFCLLADYEDYVRTQDRVSTLYRNKDLWTRKSILNVARMGKFSSDRAIAEYARDIWGLKCVDLES